MSTARLLTCFAVVISVTFGLWGLAQTRETDPVDKADPTAAPPLDVAAFVKMLRADPQAVQSGYFGQGIRVRLESTIVATGHRTAGGRVHDVSFRLLDNDVYVVCRFVGRDAGQLAAGNYQGKRLVLDGELGGVPDDGLITNELRPRLGPSEVRELLDDVVRGRRDVPLRTPDFVLHRCRVISLED